jgi:hypothetical protein
LGFFGAGALSTSGCQSIAGIEERSLDRHAILCRDYCDTVMENCVAENALYTNDAQCMGACLALEPGFSEPTGNTVSCRLNRAQAAAREPGVECRLAGPGGGGGPCGSDCEAWCTLLGAACPEEAAQLGDECESTCETALLDLGSFNLERDYGGDTLQCRLVHTVVSFEDPGVHCGHSGLVPTAMCVPGSDAEPSCEELCRITQATCTGDHAVYESTEECLAACGVFDLGTSGDQAHFSVGCRTYHARTAQDTNGAAVHCPHAGPTGEGQCGTDADAVTTANCRNYCLLLEAGCSEFETVWTFTDLEACEVACGSELAGKGAETASPGYSLASAASGDTLRCRARHAVKAVAAAALPGAPDVEAHCQAAVGAAAPCQ